MAALKLSLWTSLVVAAVNAVAGTATAWVLVRDQFRGKAAINALIDLPFALPTIVVGIILLALVGPTSPVGIHAVATTWAILMALLFVTLPFVVRSVQPVRPGARPRDGGGGGVAGRVARRRSSAASCCPTSSRPSSRARR